MADRPRVLLVTSGDASEGRGHLARTIALAESLAEAVPPSWPSSAAGSATSSSRRSRRRRWSSRPGSMTAASADAVVVDLPDPAEVVDRWPADRLIVFDDGDAFGGDAAVVVQPSMPAWSGRGRARAVLAGYGFAPIRPGLRQLAATRRLRRTRRRSSSASAAAIPSTSRPASCPAIADAVSAAVDPPRAAVVAIVGADYRGGLAGGHGWLLLRDPADLDRRLAAATAGRARRRDDEARGRLSRRAGAARRGRAGPAGRRPGLRRDGGRAIPRRRADARSASGGSGGGLPAGRRGDARRDGPRRIGRRSTAAAPNGSRPPSSTSRPARREPDGPAARPVYHRHR